MKTAIQTALLAVQCLSAAISTHGQGTFQNLDFERANVTGYAPGSTDVPASNALPGWTAYFVNPPPFGSNQVTEVAYDNSSLGGAAVAVIDVNNAFGPPPLQGNYSVWLFGSGGSGETDIAAMISQTGLVPSAAKSLLMDASPGGQSDLAVTLGGHTINMVALHTFSNYTLYGGDISSLAGHTAELDITALPVALPNAELVDDIVFSPNAIPEPSMFALAALGALSLVLNRWRAGR